MSARSEAAGALAFKDWLLFPLHTADDGVCSCGRPECSSPAKHPRTAHGVSEATSSMEAIAAWWTRWPEANIGLATGDGLMVLDSDPPLPPEAAELVSALPETLSAYTGRPDGIHRYLWVPEGFKIVNRARAGSRLPAGLDVRGDGGYVVAPPSVHASGAVYRWVDQSIEVAECPGWLLELVRKREAPRLVVHKSKPHDVYIGRPSKWGNPFKIGEHGTREEVVAKYEKWVRAQPALMAALGELRGKMLGCWCAPEACHGDVLARLAAVLPAGKVPGEVSAYARAALEGELEAVRGAGEGTRNDTYNIAVLKLAGLVAGGELPEGLVYDELTSAALAVGLEAREVQATWRSALGAGVQKPRTAPKRPPEQWKGAPRQESPPEPEKPTEAIVAGAFEATQALPNGALAHVAPEPVEYPIGVWPGPIAEFIQETATSVCVAPEAVGTCVLAVAAGAIGSSRWLAVKDDWIERPGIYAGLVAASGERKSPAMRAVKAPLEAIHGEAAARWLREHEEWEADKGKEQEPELAAPMLKDVTTEVLGLALRAHQRGVILVRPELVGWVKSHGQYKAGRGDDRQKWLEAHDQELLDVRRVGRKPILVPHPVVSVLGGVQPAVFASITAVDDGLAERFLYDVMPPQELLASTPAASRRARETWEAVVRELYGLREAEVVCEAEGCMTEARQRALDLRKGAPARMRSYFGKGEMHLARIALVLQAVWSVSGGAGQTLTADGVQRAEDLWGFYADQAQMLFCGDVVPVAAFEPATPARESELVRWLKGRGGRATKRDVTHGPLQRMSSKEVEVALSTAALHGAVRQVEGERGRVWVELVES